MSRPACGRRGLRAGADDRHRAQQVAAYVAPANPQHDRSRVLRSSSWAGQPDLYQRKVSAAPHRSSALDPACAATRVDQRTPARAGGTGCDDRRATVAMGPSRAMADPTARSPGSDSRLTAIRACNSAAASSSDSGGNSLLLRCCRSRRASCGHDIHSSSRAAPRLRPIPPDPGGQAGQVRDSPRQPDAQVQAAHRLTCAPSRSRAAVVASGNGQRRTAAAGTAAAIDHPVPRRRCAPRGLWPPEPGRRPQPRRSRIPAISTNVGRRRVRRTSTRSNNGPPAAPGSDGAGSSSLQGRPAGSSARPAYTDSWRAPVGTEPGTGTESAACQTHGAGLKRLPQRIEHPGTELGRLVKQKHAGVRRVTRPIRGPLGGVPPPTSAMSVVPDTW